MRQKTEFAACPTPYKVERIGEHSAKVSFAENAVEIKTETGSRWEADVYELVTAYTINIEDRIESNFDAWIKHAKDVDFEKNAAEPTLEERVADIEALVKGTPTYGELLEAVNLLLEA